MRALLCLLALGLVAQLNAAEWLTNYDQALAKAKAENKPILIDFTGSDWCGWCIRLKSEVFSKPEFESWAQQNVVLLEVDFPRNKPQNATLRAQNQKLAEAYNIEGFPTLVLLNAQGQEIGREGYQRGGPSVMIRRLEKLF